MLRPASIRRNLLPFAVFLLAAGCTDPMVVPGVLPEPSGAQEPADPALAWLNEAVLDDAATQMGIDKARLRTESAEKVTWPDGSLGCPEPGMAYTQALVPGYRIMVRAGERVLDYHAGQNRRFVLCPEGRAVEPRPGGKSVHGM